MGIPDALDRLTAELPSSVDLRLVVTDMDGTLLDGAGRLPARLTEVVTRLRQAGVAFVPASGRQLANLQETFGDLVAGGPIIAENGTVVTIGERELYRNTIPREYVETAIHEVRRLAAAGVDVGTVLATPHVAWVERTDERYLEQVGIYYHSRRTVDDLLDLPLDDVVKVAVHDFGTSETDSYPSLVKACPQLQTVVSGLHWTDLMAYDASKGLALQALQKEMGVTPAQTAVFGDYLNDLALYDYSELSFAMANAHPDLKAAANYEAPANTEDGVLRTVELLLDRLAH